MIEKGVELPIHKLKISNKTTPAFHPNYECIHSIVIACVGERKHFDRMLSFIRSFIIMRIMEFHKINVNEAEMEYSNPLYYVGSFYSFCSLFFQGSIGFLLLFIVHSFLLISYFFFFFLIGHSRKFHLVILWCI